VTKIMRLISNTALALAAAAAVGCAAGNTVPVTAPFGFSLDYRGTGTVAIAVRDQRPDVVSGNRKESLFGHQRSLYGIPFPVNTASGQPFAIDFASLIVQGLKAKGVSATSVRVSPFKSEDDAIAALAATGSDRSFLFTLTEWDADTYSRTTLHYDIKLAVLDKQGTLLGQTSIAGEDELKSSARPERQSIPAATADIVQTLLAAKSVVAALAPGAAPTKKCTVDQILKMQESGLTKQQIEAACGSGPTT
jgi:hypothetical protein